MRIPVSLALVTCSVGLVVAGCGSDDDPATPTGGGTTSPGTATEIAVEQCPDTTVDIGGTQVTVTEIQTDAGCESVVPLASDVLARDDCVEETTGGVNDCQSLGYTCATTLPGGSEVLFAVSCSSRNSHAEFSQARQPVTTTANADCGDLFNDGAFLGAIRTTGADCVTARSVVREWSMTDCSTKPCSTPSGYECNTLREEFEFASWICTSGSASIRFATGA